MKIQLDIIRFCQRHHVPFIQEGHHHCHVGWIQIHCPWCGPGWTLGFNLTDNYMNCWRCGSHTAWDFIGKTIGTSDTSLIGRTLYEFEQKDRAVRSESKVKTRKRSIPAPPGTKDMGPQHTTYLQNRGFDPTRLADEWGLLGTFHISGLWSWRVIIPIQDRDGRPVAYQGRTILNRKPKYKMTDNADILVDPKELLYGLHRVPHDSVIIVEGVTGVWKLGPGAVATFGIDWKKEQANILRQYTKRFILFDPEPTAQQRAMELAKWLSFYSGQTEVLSGFNTDPGDMSDRRARKVMQEIGF